MTKPDIERFVIAYRRSDEHIHEELPLRIGLVELQVLFSRPNDDPMYDAYPVTEAQRASLEKILGKHLDLSRYDYFVESWKVPS